MELRIAGVEPESIVDGPGIRFALFVQGCPHHCKGCHNPQTWDFSGGETVTTDEVFAMIKDDPLLDGITFSGGEPFGQCHALIELADRIRKGGWSLIMAGGLSNTLDRMVRHYVVDYIPKGKYVYNLGDFAIGAGAAGFLAGTMLEKRAEGKETI